MLALYMAVTHMRSVARQMGFLGKMWTKKGGSGGRGGEGKGGSGRRPGWKNPGGPGQWFVAQFNNNKDVILQYIKIAVFHKCNITKYLLKINTACHTLIQL